MMSVDALVWDRDRPPHFLAVTSAQAQYLLELGVIEEHRGPNSYIVKAGWVPISKLLELREE